MAKNYGNIGISTKTGSKVYTPQGGVIYSTPSGSIGMSVAPKVASPTSISSGNIGMSTPYGSKVVTPQGGTIYNTRGGSIGFSSPTGQAIAPTPTSYLAGSVLGASTQASTPLLTGKIPMTSLSSSSATSTPSGATYAGASPIPVPSAPSTTYNAMNNNAQYGATGTTGLFETSTTNADGTVKITPTTGTDTRSDGQKLADEYGLEKPQSITDEYYDSSAYKAQQRAAQQMNNTQNQINSVTTRLNLDLQNLRGVGAREGVTEAVYGQQSSQIIREGNNLLLPLQAQLAADQGNLKLATDTLDTWAKLRQADIDNEYSYKKQIATWLRENETAETKARIDKAEKIADRQHDVDMANLNYDLAVKKEGLTGNTLLSDPAQLVAYAQQYASTGMIPTGLPKGSFGVVSAYAKELPKSQGQILDKATGVTPDKLGAAGDAYGALYSAIELSKQLKELDKKRVGGVVSGTLGKVFGSADQQRYVDLRSQIVDLLSRARSGAALTESEEKRYGNMLPGRFSESFGLGANSDVRIDNFTTALTSDLTNKVNSKGWVVNGISKVDLGGTKYTVGDVIEVNGVRGRINADGSITKL